jgi:ribokinase
MKYDVVTIGDASEDIFVKPRDLKVIKDSKMLSGKAASFELGEKILLEDVQYEVGGSACNTSVAFRRQGYTSSLIVAIGQDTPGKKVLERLDEEFVSTELIIQQESYKTNFSIVFNIDDERTIFVYHGLKDYSCLVPNKSLNTKWIYLAPIGQGDEDVIDKVSILAAEKNVKVGWNPGVIQIEKKAQHYRQMLKCLDILFVNREEGIRFANFPVKPQIKDIVKVLHGYGPKTVVLTDGKNGAYAYDGNNHYHISAVNQQRVDATGAGDSFAAGFMGRIMLGDMSNRQDSIVDALKWGALNSTSVVGYIGAQKGLLTKDALIDGALNSDIKVEVCS